MQVYVNECYNIEDQANSCYFHPDEIFVGVCHLCLNERLIILASLSKNSIYCLHRRSFNFCSEDNKFSGRGYSDKKPALQKILSFGSGIFRGRRKSNDFAAPDRDFDDSVSTSSQEDSYISFKIEDNGTASWEKNYTINNRTNKSGNKTIDDDSKNATEAAKHGKHNNIHEKKNVSDQLGDPIQPKQSEKAHRWHNRIGQLIKKKGSMRGWVCQLRIDKVAERVEIRKSSWIRRTLTK